MKNVQPLFFEILWDLWARLRAAVSTLQQRKIVESQKSPTDCGYICVAAVLALFGRRLTVAEIKEHCGSTSRGLDLRQLRDVLETCGAVAKVVQFDRKRSQCYPCPGIILLERGHYILIGAKGRNWLDAYYPEYGWLRQPTKRVMREANGLGVVIESVTPVTTQPKRFSGDILLTLFLRKARSKLGLGVFLLSLISQCFILLLPLLTKQSVDAFQIGTNATFVGTIAIGFLLISGLGSLMTLLSDYASQILSQRVWRLVSSEIYDSLAVKPASWFETHHSTDVLNILNAIDTQLKQFGDLIGATGAFAVTFTVGIVLLLMISPWLSLPGILSAIISIILGLFFGVKYRSLQFVSLEAQQQRRSFIVDVLGQLPVIARLGGLKRTGKKYAHTVRRSAEADLRLSLIKARRSAAGSLLSTIEAFAFVTVVSYFMKVGNYSLGAFVAVGVYKNTFVRSLYILFQKIQSYQNLDYHRMLTGSLMRNAPPATRMERQLTDGMVEFRSVSYSYGELESPVFTGVSFSVHPSEAVAIDGPSGAGKSTIAKLVCGVLQPTHGKVLVDGMPPELPIIGLGSVFQSDRLISGTIRENIRLFRAHLSDEDIYRALEICALKDFVLTLPMRLNMPISENMPGLSGGQRQRILLARAVVFRPRLLVLDEATSSLDVASEATIMQNLLATGASLILISHRPEVWRYATRFYTISKGLLIERGP